MSYAILRTAKLKTMGNISGSLAHTYRTIDTPNADPSRTYLNDNSLPSHADALKAIQDKLPSKTRKNGVLCVEYLITASPDWGGWGTEKQAQYLNDARQWLEEKHGKDNVAMVGIQLDETTPHLVAYVLPYDDKGKMNARHWLGGRDKLSKMQTDFHDKVGKNYGLERGIEGSKAKHETVKKYYSEIQQPVEQINLALPESGRIESGGRYKMRIENELKEVIENANEKMKALENELKIKNKELKQTKKQLNTLIEKTALYTKAKEKLGHWLGKQFDKEIFKYADSLYQHRQDAVDKAVERDRQARQAEEQQRQAEQARKLEQAKLAEQARLARLGVDVIADGKGVYHGKVVKVDDNGAYQQTKQGVILHPRWTNLQAGKVWSIDYDKRQATPEYDTSHFGKNRNQDKGRDL